MTNTKKMIQNSTNDFLEHIENTGALIDYSPEKKVFNPTIKDINVISESYKNAAHRHIFQEERTFLKQEFELLMNEIIQDDDLVGYNKDGSLVLEQDEIDELLSILIDGGLENG